MMIWIVISSMVRAISRKGSDEDQGFDDDDEEIEYLSIQMPAAKAFLRNMTEENQGNNKSRGFIKEFVPHTPEFQWPDVNNSKEDVSPVRIHRVGFDNNLQPPQFQALLLLEALRPLNPSSSY